MSLEDVRERVYARYVTDNMGLLGKFDGLAYKRWSQNTYRQIARWLPKDHEARILDAACGAGNLLHLLRSRGYENVEGVDRSPEQVALARRIVVDVEVGDVFEYLRVREGPFDLVLAFDLIEHFGKSEVFEFLDLVFRALRPGGVLIVQTPNANSPWLPSIRYGDFTHEIAFNPHSLENVLRLTGFVDYEARETGPVVHGPSSGARWLVWQTIRGVLALVNAVETGTTGGFIFSRVFRARAVRPYESGLSGSD